MPEDWAATLQGWVARNGRYRDGDAPSRLDEVMLYQTLVGIWPGTLEEGFEDRVAAWQEKAMHEAKLETSWTSPNGEYEKAAREFLRSVLADAGFLAELTALVERIAAAGALNGIAQVLLKLTVPGVPDIYQGTEFWDFSLVDPDNRRPVDYAARVAALAEAQPPELTADDTGKAKLAVTHRLLTLRAEQPGLFAKGDYTPLELGERWLGFTRRGGTGTLLVVVPTAKLATGDWPSLPAPPGAGEWRCALTDAAWQGVSSLDPAFPFIVATHS